MATVTKSIKVPMIEFEEDEDGKWWWIEGKDDEEDDVEHGPFDTLQEAEDDADVAIRDGEVQLHNAGVAYDEDDPP